jgi:hypothetical protein
VRFLQKAYSFEYSFALNRIAILSMSHHASIEPYRVLVETNSPMVSLTNFWNPGLFRRDQFNFQNEGPREAELIKRIVTSTPA